MSELRIPLAVKTFGQAIRWAREQRRMTARQLAAAVGVSPAFVCDLEHDRRTTARTEDFAARLGVSIADLEARSGVSPDLTEWLKSRPDLVQLLRDIREGRKGPNILRRAR